MEVPSASPISIDVEVLISWAFSQTSALPWRNPTDRSIAWNRGWTAVPKGYPRTLGGGETAIRRAQEHDAELVLNAVRRLPDQKVREVVQACAMKGRRPNWLEGVEPVMIEKKVSWRRLRRRKKGKRPSGRSHFEKVWDPVTPETILIVREMYAAWHAALIDIGRSVGPLLEKHEINGLAAPSAPWEKASEKSIDCAQIPYSLAAGGSGPISRPVGMVSGQCR